MILQLKFTNNPNKKFDFLHNLKTHNPAFSLHNGEAILEKLNEFSLDNIKNYEKFNKTTAPLAFTNYVNKLMVSKNPNKKIPLLQHAVSGFHIDELELQVKARVLSNIFKYGAMGMLTASSVKGFKTELVNITSDSFLKGITRKSAPDYFFMLDHEKLDGNSVIITDKSTKKTYHTNTIVGLLLLNQSKIADEILNILSNGDKIKILALAAQSIEHITSEIKNKVFNEVLTETLNAVNQRLMATEINKPTTKKKKTPI